MLLLYIEYQLSIDLTHYLTTVIFIKKKISIHDKPQHIACITMQLYQCDILVAAYVASKKDKLLLTNFFGSHDLHIFFVFSN